MMPVLYTKLFQGKSLQDAVREARRKLLEDKARQANYGREIELEDWILPVLYERRSESVRLTPCEMTPSQQADWDERQARRAREPATAVGPFFGRDLDILRIERQLDDHNVLLIHAGGGTGKTTLIEHLGYWWRRTGWIEGAPLVFEYDRQAWTRDAILMALADLLLPAPEAGAIKAQTARTAADAPSPLEVRITTVLRSTPRLLVLDNLESVTGEAFAVRHELDADQREEIREFLAGLVGGKTRILLGSRGLVPWLEKGVIRKGLGVPGVPAPGHALGGLDPEAASELAKAVFDQAGIDSKSLDPNDLGRLMKLLAGHPLAIGAVLPTLARHGPGAVLEILEGRQAIDLGSADAEERTRSILACVAYSHDVLDAELQALLETLAPFQGVFWAQSADAFVQQLQAEPALSGLALDRFGEMLTAAQRITLLRPHDALGEAGYLVLQPTLPFFLADRLSDPAAEPRRAAIHRAFRNHMRGLGGVIAEMLGSNEPQQRQIGQTLTSLEYGNLTSAIQSAMRAFEPIADLISAPNRLLRQTGAKQPLAQLSQAVIAGVAAYPEAELDEAMRMDHVMVLGNAATALMDVQEFDRAREGYLSVLARVDALTTSEPNWAARMRATTHHQLGMVAQRARDWDEARGQYTRALEICTKVKDEHSAALSHHHLGIVAELTRDWDEARAQYTRALEIFTEVKDEHSAASTHHQLGRVAELIRDWDEARAQYTRALEIKTKFKDEHSAAGTHHHLGMVAELTRDWDEARAQYTRALEIFTKFNDEHSAARTHHQLGIVAQETRDWDEARAQLNRALESKTKFKDEHSAAGTHHQLGIVAQETRDWDEARAQYTRALEIYTKFNDEYEAAGTHHQLGMVAQETGDWDEARAQYTRALEIFTKVKDEHSAVIVIRSIARLARTAPDQREALAGRLAEVLKSTPDEAAKLLENVPEDKGDAG